MKMTIQKKWCVVIVVAAFSFVAERGYSQLLIRTALPKTTLLTTAAVSSYNPFTKTAVQAVAPIQETSSLTRSSSFSTTALWSFRPPIRIPYRPPVRSPYKPPL